MERILIKKLTSNWVTVIFLKQCGNHLGVGLVTTNKSELEYMYINRRICWSTLFSKWIGNKIVPLLPVTASKLYWGVCFPKLTYPFEVMDVHSTSPESVESFHYQAAKFVHGLPVRAGQPDPTNISQTQTGKIHFCSCFF